MAANKPQRAEQSAAEPRTEGGSTQQPAGGPAGKGQPQPVATGIAAAAAQGAAVGAGGHDPAAPADAANQTTQRIDPAAEHEYWRAHYTQRPYAKDDLPYEALASAYEHGWQSASRHGRTATGEPARFEDLEPQLRSAWEAQQRDRVIAWELAQHATRDAWERVQAAMAEEPAKPSAR